MDAQGDDGFTALLVASQEGQYEVVRALLNGRADVNARRAMACGGVDDGVAGRSPGGGTRHQLAANANVDAATNDGNTRP